MYKLVIIFILLCLNCKKECIIDLSSCSNLKFCGNWKLNYLTQYKLDNILIKSEEVSGNIIFYENNTATGTGFANSEFEWHYDCVRNKILTFKENNNRGANNYFYNNFTVDFINVDSLILSGEQYATPIHKVDLNTIIYKKLVLIRN